MSSRLAAANVRNEPAPVQEVIKLLLDLKGAWEAIDSNKATAQVLNQAKGTQQGYTQQAKV